MRVAIGSDHRGVEIRGTLARLLQARGHDVVDAGTHDTGSVDYPDIAAAVAKQVSAGEVERGILICGTGIGMAIAANKIRGVRAAAVHSADEARVSREHNNLNVLCLSGDLCTEENLGPVLDVWLETEFGGGRHARRVAKIAELESA